MKHRIHCHLGEAFPESRSENVFLGEGKKTGGSKKWKMLIKNFKVLMDGLLLLGGNFIFKIMAVFVFSDGIFSWVWNFSAHQWNLQFQIITFKGSNRVVLALGKTTFFLLQAYHGLGRSLKHHGLDCWFGCIFWGETLFFVLCCVFVHAWKKKSCLKPETSMYKCFLHNQETWQPDGVSSDVPEVKKWFVSKWVISPTYKFGVHLLAVSLPNWSVHHWNPKFLTTGPSKG